MNLKADFFSRAGSRVVFLAAFLAFLLPVAAAQPDDLPLARERRPFNDDWVFQKDGPSDTQGKLDYASVKNWVNATGSELSTNPPAARPIGEPAGNISYAQTNFDDSAWVKTVLPHDWAIGAPFDQACL